MQRCRSGDMGLLWGDLALVKADRGAIGVVEDVLGSEGRQLESGEAFRVGFVEERGSKRALESCEASQEVDKVRDFA